MLSTKEMDTKTRFVNRLAHFLHKNRIILLTLLIASSVALVGYFIWTEWQRRTNEDSTLLAEEAQGLYQEWQLEADEENKKKLEEDLNSSLDLIINRYPRKYAVQRALFIRADLCFDKEEWETATENYQKLAGDFPKGYLAALSLFNAAVCYEEMNDPDRALELYRRTAELYGESYLIPHALFSLGRLYEQKQDFENAISAYNRLETEYPFSNWTKAGRNRIIDVRIKGKTAQ
ncbi:Cell division coordinator CpoB [subsurface metagenome]